MIDSVAFRLARADQLAYQFGLVAAQWSRNPLDLVQWANDDGTLDVVVRGVRPVPPTASLLFSETVHHLRSAVENTVYHLVEQKHGPLTESESRQVAMPIYETSVDFGKWGDKQAGRKGVPELAPGSEIHTRIASLQPFASADKVPSIDPLLASLMNVAVIETHPLLLLQGYSNSDKHRAVRPALFRTLIHGRSDRTMRPIGVNDIVAVADPKKPSALDLSSALHIQRPGTDAWVAPGAELGHLYDYVADVLISTLVSGVAAVGAFPAQIDLTDNGLSAQERLGAATDKRAHERMREYMAVGEESELTRLPTIEKPPSGRFPV